MFRDDTACCPACEAALNPLADRWLCGGCGAILIDPANLTALLVEVSPDDRRPFERRVFLKGVTGNTCPSCATKMMRGTIHDCELEQCSVHGVFMRKHAFAQLLTRQGELYVQRTQPVTPLLYLGVVPIVGMVGVLAHTAVAPLVKRWRLRKYLARTTPPKSR